MQALRDSWSTCTLNTYIENWFSYNRTIFIQWLMFGLKMDLSSCSLLWTRPVEQRQISATPKPPTSLLARWIGRTTSIETYAEYLFDWAEPLNVREKTILCIFMEKKGKVNPSVSFSLLSQSTLPVYDIAFVRKISNGIVLFFKLGRECQCELRWNIWHESQMTSSASNKQVPQVLSW